VKVPESELTELRRRINATSRMIAGGAARDARYSAMDCDWRNIEAKLSALPQFITEIDGLDIHFIHVRSKHDHALPLIGEWQVSETMNLHQVPETMTLHRALWAGRIMSALVVIALVADGTIQLFAPAQFASMLQETGFAMDLTRIVGPIILACAILYAIPATAVLGAILVTGFLGGAICAHVRIGELGSPPEIISLLLGAMTWGGLYARDPRIRAILPLVR
jgi:Epoxide hydrolase N terminus/DoxX-like family